MLKEYYRNVTVAEASCCGVLWVKEVMLSTKMQSPPANQPPDDKVTARAGGSGQIVFPYSLVWPEHVCYPSTQHLLIEKRIDSVLYVCLKLCSLWSVRRFVRTSALDDTFGSNRCTQIKVLSSSADTAKLSSKIMGKTESLLFSTVQTWSWPEEKYVIYVNVLNINWPNL